MLWGLSRVISWGKQSLGVSLDDATDQESTLATRQRERERNTVGERGGEGRRQREREKERGIQLGREEERGVSEGRGKVTHFEDQLVLGRLRIEPLASFDDPCHL